MSFYSQALTRTTRQTRNHRSPSPAADLSDDDEGYVYNSDKTKVVTLGEALKSLTDDQKNRFAELISVEEREMVTTFLSVLTVVQEIFNSQVFASMLTQSYRSYFLFPELHPVVKWLLQYFKSLS